MMIAWFMMEYMHKSMHIYIHIHVCVHCDSMYYTYTYNSIIETCISLETMLTSGRILSIRYFSF